MTNKTGSYSTSCIAPKQWVVTRNGFTLSSQVFTSRKQADKAMWVALHAEGLALGVTTS